MFLKRPTGYLDEAKIGAPGNKNPPAGMTDRDSALFYETLRVILQKIIINLDLHLLQR